MCAGDGRQVTGLALEAEAGSVDKAKKWTAPAPQNSWLSWLTSLVNNILSANLI
jgi:hypothetical protein